MRAHAHFTLWKHLRNYTSTHNKEVNEAPFFFGFTIRAHRAAALAHIFRVIDKSRNSLNIWKFLDFVEQNIGIFSPEAFAQRKRVVYKADEEMYAAVVRFHRPASASTVCKDRATLEKFKGTVENLRKWRNKEFAHVDEKTLTDEVDVTKDYPVKIGEIEEILTKIFDILNGYLNAYESSTWLMDWGGQDDITQVIEALRFRRDIELQEFGMLKKREEPPGDA